MRLALLPAVPERTPILVSGHLHTPGSGAALVQVPGRVAIPVVRANAARRRAGVQHACSVPAAAEAVADRCRALVRICCRHRSLQSRHELFV